MPRPKRDKNNPNLKPWLTSALRRCSYRWPARNIALSAARIERGLYKCAICEGTFGKKGVQLDHIIPVVSIKDGWTTWDDFINKLFCSPDKFQVICTQCHDSKTQIEETLRKKYRDERKENDSKN